MADELSGLQLREAESWRAIAGFEGRYEVSSAGNIRSVAYEVRRADGRNFVRPGQPIKIKASGNTPYVRARLRSPGGKPISLSVHRLVLIAFVGEPPANAVAMHLDGNPANNRVSNLAWGTQSENCRDKVRHGTAQVGDRNPRATMTEVQARQILRRYSLGESLRAIAAHFGLSLHAVRALAGGKSWKHLRSRS